MERIPEYPEHERPTSRVVKLGEETGLFINLSQTPSFTDQVEPLPCDDEQGVWYESKGSGGEYWSSSHPHVSFFSGEDAADSNDVFGTVPNIMVEGADIEVILRQYFTILFAKLDSQFARLEMRTKKTFDGAGVAPSRPRKISKATSRVSRVMYATDVSNGTKSDCHLERVCTDRTWDPSPAFRQPEAAARSKGMLKTPRTLYLVSERLVNKSARKIWQRPDAEWFFGFLIFLNAVFIGYETDYRANFIGEDVPSWIFGVSTFFTAAFTLELVLKIFFDRLALLRRDQIFWSGLDVVIVVMSLVELACDTLPAGVGVSSGVKNTNQFRVLRMVRMTRLIRVIRVTRIIKVIRSLRTLVHQLAHTTQSLLWGLALLTLVIFLFGIFFTQNVTTYREDNGADAGGVIDDRVSPMIRYWSTVPRSMKTLYMCITGGVNWIEVVAPLSDLNSWSVALFVAYVAFVQFAVLNVITGVFCQNAIESARRDQDLVMHSILEEKERYTDRLREIFRELDTDGSGTITLQEFHDQLGNERFQAYFASLDIEISDLRVFFKLVDLNGGDDIDIDEFISSCLRLRGNARSIDLAKMMHDQRRMSRRFEEFMVQTTEVLKRLTPRV